MPARISPKSGFIAISEDAQRATVVNGTRPRQELPEPDTADMEYFLDQVLLVMPVLGFSFMQPKPVFTAPVPASPAAQQEPDFELIQGDKIRAYAREANGQLVVLRGSFAKSRVETSIPKGYLMKRQSLIDEGQLRPSSDPDLYEFTENVAFDAPSGAAAVILAMSANGRERWKVKNSSKTYGEWQNEKLSALFAREHTDDEDYQDQDDDGQ